MQAGGRIFNMPFSEAFSLSSWVNICLAKKTISSQTLFSYQCRLLNSNTSDKTGGKLGMFGFVDKILGTIEMN